MIAFVGLTKPILPEVEKMLRAMKMRDKIVHYSYSEISKLVAEGKVPKLKCAFVQLKAVDDNRPTGQPRVIDWLGEFCRYNVRGEERTRTVYIVHQNVVTESLKSQFNQFGVTRGFSLSELDPAHSISTLPRILRPTNPAAA